VSTTPQDPAGRRRKARIAAPIAAVVLYAICVTVLLVVLGAIFGSLSRDRFGGAALLWAIYLLPALIAPAAGALLNAVFFGKEGRQAAYWPNLGLIGAFTGIAILWLLLAGGTWNAILALVQLAGGFLAWYLLHGAARGDAKRRG
jgi:hypothetical protein